jgi:hypothetical protein
MVQRMTDTADALTLDLSTPFGRAMAALLDPDSTYTGEQLAWFMGEAARWVRESAFDEGYRARVAEENAAYPPERMDVYSGGGWIDRVDYRRRCDAEARQPRPGDFRPGDRVRPMPTTWCGDVTPHPRHVTTSDDGERYRCQGRRHA